MNEQKYLAGKIKRWVIAFVVLLVLSGITAFPIQWELNLVYAFMKNFPSNNDLAHWYFKVYEGVNETWSKYPFIAYGTDWLAFAHIVIGLAFIGVYRNPVQNIWVVEWAMLSCLLVIPLAWIAGEVRGIPFFWRMIDCSFGVFGIIPLFFIRNKIKQLESLTRPRHE
jgi:hypothetical protein